MCVRCRLVRAILGEDAISKRKLEYGNPMTVLGIKIEANLAGVVFTPDEEKVRTPRTVCSLVHMDTNALCICRLQFGQKTLKRR